MNLWRFIFSRLIRKWETGLLAAVIFLFFVPVVQAENLSILVIDGESYLVHQAVRELDLPAHLQVRAFTLEDLKSNPAAKEFIIASKVVLVDVMMNELSQYLIENHLTENRRVYAMRGSRDEEGLKKKGFIFHPEVKAYFDHLSKTNLVNLIRRVINLSLDSLIAYEPVLQQPALGIYHPQAPNIFTQFDDYHRWHVGRAEYNPAAPWVGLMFFSASLVDGQVESSRQIILALEKAGFNVLPCFGTEEEVLTKLLLDAGRQPRVDLVVSFSLKFRSAISDRVKAALGNLKVPVINAINLYGINVDRWRSDPIGIPALDVVWSVAMPEISGAIEPSPLTGKFETFDPDTGSRLYMFRAIEESLEQLIPRLKKWTALRSKPQAEKRVAILYYNHSQGKQNVGASYLNVFRSLEVILDRMRDEGYSIPKDHVLSEKTIREMVLQTGLNIGSWAPGELERMTAEKKLVRVPLAEYRTWFDQLPSTFKDAVIEQWGPPESADIMVQKGNLIIPAIILGNVVLMPEPARGWSDAPMKLYHDLTVYPHHQYIAAYLWLKHGFQADAMIHLGTHATHEWLPGKQAGLSPACPPEVLITDIPNVYPYIVDNIGEGLQAKRRGRGVIIDHLTPPLKSSGLYHEYDQLHRLIEDYEKGRALGAQTTQVYLERIQDLVRRSGLDKDLKLKVVDDQTVSQIDIYLHEIEDDLLPYGLHTFGRSPDGPALEESIQAISSRNPVVKPETLRESLALSGSREIDHLLAALSGKYVPPGEGNDPIRNPTALPTGNNFYGFSPAKIPSSAAWRLGKQAAEEIIQKSLAENKRYPEKVAVVLWATETLRNEGINECTILYLMGIAPLWDQSDRVIGTRAIPGTELQRPRIDVLINPSGLYRDLFPDKLLFLDKAVRQAATQKDIENLISRNNQRIKEQLIQTGLSEPQAEELSGIRIFTEAPGAYGNRVSEMSGASGFWKTDDEIAKVYEKHTGFAYGQGKWGEPALQLLRENLKTVDTVVHSISSNIYGTMDNDDVFSYLGGLSLAVRKASGQTPETMITMQRQPNRLHVEDVAQTIGRELRTRYLNPKWITGMKAENYAGAREMSKFMEYLWGWQVTVPSAVDRTSWQQTYEVYVEDKYGQDLKEFFNRANPWAFQSMTARMLESIRKGYWEAGEQIQKKLAAEYAINVVEKGVACCDHTCNNPLFNQMVVSIISLPGVLSPEVAAQFKMAIEKATGRELAEQVQARSRLNEALNDGFSPSDNQSSRIDEKDDTKRQEKPAKESSAPDRMVEGYRMEEVTKGEEHVQVGSSGVQWFGALIVLALIGLFIVGARRWKNHSTPSGYKGFRTP